MSRQMYSSVAISGGAHAGLKLGLSHLEAILVKLEEQGWEDSFVHFDLKNMYFAAVDVVEAYENVIK